MAKKETISGVPLAPLTGTMDVRSSVNLMPQGSLRMRQNLQTVGENKLRRGTGFQKFLTGDSVYNNADFHDQLLHFTETIRQPITMLFRAESSRQTRQLYLATQQTIAVLNEGPGTFRILGDGYGGDAVTTASTYRFHAAQQGNYVAFTNDYESPMSILMDSDEPPEPIADLATIGLTRAACIWTFRNCLFLANVEMDGERKANRLVWSDFDVAISFDPAKGESITGHKDLDTGERILAGLPFGDSFLIYTTKSIWEMVVVGGDRSFDCIKRFDSAKAEGAGVCRYPNTLVACPEYHMYLGEDGAYAYNTYFGQPERIEWLHRSTPLILDDIDSVNCNVHVAVAGNNECLISTAPVDAPDNCPTRTLRINLTYKTVDFVDTGFTAFANYEAGGAIKTIKDFVIEMGICTVEGLNAILADPVMEIDPIEESLPREDPESTAAFTPMSIYTLTEKVVTVNEGTVDEESVSIEDWEKDEADCNSLCALLAGVTAEESTSTEGCSITPGATLDDYCRGCKPDNLLVAASSIDWCLKQLGGEVFYREVCQNPTEPGVTSEVGYAAAHGSYTLNPYDSIIRPAPIFLVGQSDMVKMTSVNLEILPADEPDPPSIGLRVGIAAQPGADPNVDVARIVWHQHSLKPIRKQTSRTPAEHLALNSIPHDSFDWVFYRKGKVLYIELKISGIDGDCELAGLETLVELEESTS